ncbi:exodeoxyribonuclease VII small subunit [Bacillota bacterium LX-D]|nr:exodeoxyribonuclease VII small subunit [Bacillota bacterium LX-D]
MKKISYEEAMQRLEILIKELEAGNDSLDGALAKFEEGVKLIQYCQQKLNKVEQKISVLIESGLNNLQVEPWKAEEGQNES